MDKCLDTILLHKLVLIGLDTDIDFFFKCKMLIVELDTEFQTAE